jgi:co-chaperonin GroES (HSP10)
MQPPKLSNIQALIESVRPLHDFVLVRRSPDEDRYGRIILPTGNRGMMKPGLKRGIAVAVGRGDKFTMKPKGNGELFRKRFSGERMPMHVRPGDEVIFSRSPANNTLIDGQEYVFVHEELIFGIIEKEASDGAQT